MKLKILFVVMAIVGVMLTLQINGALAGHYEEGENGFWINNFYDTRTYHDSHPNASKVHTVGGWDVGITVVNSVMQAEIDKVEIIGISKQLPYTKLYTIIQDEPDIYGWFGDTYHDYDIYIGRQSDVLGSYEIKILDIAGNTLTDPIVIVPNFDNPLPMVSKIKRLAIMKNGTLKVKFTVPYSENLNHVRLRVFDPVTGEGIAQFKYFGPFEIVRKNGTVVPDMMKVFIDGQYAGNPARLEYRTNDGNRSITFFKLPEEELE